MHYCLALHCRSRCYDSEIGSSFAPHDRAILIFLRGPNVSKETAAEQPCVEASSSVCTLLQVQNQSGAANNVTQHDLTHLNGLELPRS